MTRKLKTLLTTTGIVAGLSAAFLPLTSYAEPAKETINVAATVQPVITLDISVTDPEEPEDDMSFTVTANTVVEGSFSATVSSNKPYSLYVNAQGGQTDMLRAEDGAEPVNKIPGNGNVVEGQTGWGLKLANDGNYSPISAGMSNPLHTSTTPVSSDTTNFKVGIAVGPGLAVGTYSATLVVTATNSAASN